MSVMIKIVTRPLSTMGVNTCTLESMVSYHYPPRAKDKTRPGFGTGQIQYLLSLIIIPYERHDLHNSLEI